MIALDSAPLELGGFGLELLEASPDGVLVARADGSIVLANERLERMFGMSRGELLGRPVEALLPETDRAIHVVHRREYTANPRRREMARDLELRGKRKSGAEFPVEISLRPAMTAAGAFVIAIVRDVSEQRAAEERLRFVCSHDALTGLPNRVSFGERRRELEASRGRVGVVVVDVDGLGRVNAESGYELGDELLRRAAAVLCASFRKTDVVARVGSDEFAVLLPQAGRCELEAAVARLAAELERHNGLYGAPSLGFSVGLSMSAGGGLLEALREAERQACVGKQDHSPRRSEASKARAGLGRR